VRVVWRILGYLMGILLLPVLRTLRGRTNDAKRRVLQSLYLSIQIGGYVSHDLAKATLGSFAAIYQGSWVASGIERVKAAWSLGVIYAGTGFARLMQRCVDDAHETAERATDESARGEAAFGATICFTKMNQYERAAAEAERGLAHGSWMGAFAYVGMCTRAGMMLGLLGRVSEALVWYERAFSRIRSDVDNRFISTCRDVREVLFVIAGTPGEGKAYFERFVASKDFANGRGQIGIGTGLLFCHETGEDDALLDALLDAHERTRVSPRHPADEELPQYVGAMYAYARRALAGGDASLRNLETAVARLRGVTKWRAYAAHLPVAEALLALAKSDPAAALTHLEAAERRAVADEHVTALFETYLVRARTYVALGKPLHARLALGAAETLARELSWHGRIERLNRELRGFFQDARASENVTASQS
jgi:tetratricopeptide (TPR) repeat protein